MHGPESLAASSLLSPETITQLVQQSKTVYTSHADVKNDYQKWLKGRKLQNRYPLGKGITLKAPFDIPFKKSPSPQALSSGFRQPLRPAVDQSVGTFVGYLTLGPRLRVNRSGRSDMWLANLVDEEGSAQRLVLKIAQESSQSFPQRYLERNADLSNAKIGHPIDLVAPEFFIYERLQHLQGWLLPYSYGIHKIKMLNDEDVYVFITEFIEGRNLHPAPVPPALTNYFEKGIK
ncbi:hypothetical protein CPB85DRAFT_1331779, partial [Mucidula mucida]